MLAQFAFALLLGLLVPSAALAQNRVALVIGIDKYDNLSANAQLKKARSDAAAIARVLNDLGFDVIAGEDATRSGFNNYWQNLLNKLKPGDTVAFYFAGHGVEFGGRSYLLPRDVPNLRPGRDELLRREALSLQEFLADLREKGTRLNLVILDACRDNPFEQVAGRSLGTARGLAATEPPEGTFIMYSAGTGESALDRLNNTDRDPNSVYTRHLLPLLRTPDRPLTDIAEQVRVAVRRTASTVGHRQTPAYYNQVVGRACLARDDCGQPIAAVSSSAQPTKAEQASSTVQETAPIHECDRLASPPSYAPEGVRGIRLQHIDASRAVQACQQALVTYPGETRFAVWLARALEKASKNDEARGWYEKAAEKGHPIAMSNLGAIYAGGRGVAQDYVKARSWYEKAAESGFPIAMTNLGNLNAGGSGVAQDYVKARSWYEKAAEKGEPIAMRGLGDLYQDAKGVPRDYAMARSWFAKAAEKGDATAMFRLARLLDQGLGDANDAARHLLAAARAGFMDARTALEGSMDDWNGATLKALQEHLKASGDYSAQAHGEWGSASRTAAKAYFARQR